MVIFSSCSKEEKGLLIQEISDWEFSFEDEWHKADVPGNNFSDLLNHNFIVDPFYGTNEDSVQWVTEKNWTYRSKFSVSKRGLFYSKGDRYIKCFFWKQFFKIFFIKF